jgi:lipid-A-disaccharide synthase
VPKVLIISGEPSGDVFASGLIKSFKELHKDMQFYAMGGKNSVSAGAELIADISELSVMGFTEVILKLKTIKKTLNKITAWIAENRPDAVILVDFPSFNFKIAKSAYKLNIPVVYFIPPKIWASRYGRIKFIKKYINFVIVIFPFEYDIYKNSGVEAYYFGNPLYALHNKDIKDSADKEINLTGRYPVISFLAGSRKTELKYHTLRIIKSLLLIKASYENAFFIFPFRKEIDSTYFTSALKGCGIPPEWYAVTDSVGYALSASDLIVVASGTASLEACFYGKPVIIIYYLNYLTYLIAKLIVKIKYIGLINILAKDFIAPELVESNFTPENVLKETDKFLKDAVYRESTLSKISDTLSMLKTEADPFEASAGVIYDRILKKID